MKVKAILRRRPGRGRRPEPGVPEASPGSFERRRLASHPAWPRRLPPPPGAVLGQRELTGPPRPQPGRELQAALVASAGLSARPGGAHSAGSQVWSLSSRGGRVPDRGRRSGWWWGEEDSTRRP